MKQLLFFQGGGAGVHDHWDHHLVASLARALGAGHDIRYPRMPNEADPDLRTWTAALHAELAVLDGHAILVGHSIGATILVNVLADGAAPRSFAGLFLLSAPFIGEGGWSSESIPPMERIGTRLPAHLPVFLYHGGDDDTAPPEHLQLYAKAIPQGVACLLAGRDHQLGNDLAPVAADILALG